MSRQKTDLYSPINRERLAIRARDAAILLGISPSQFWKLHAANKLPAPVHLGAKTPRWLVHDLHAWLSAGCPDTKTWQTLREGVRS